MAQTTRRTQAIGGNSGTEFRAPEDSDISKLTLYCGQRLNGIEVVYSNCNVQKVGNTNGRFFDILNSVSDPIRTLFVYINKDSSMIVGIRIILKSGTGTTYGRETEHLRAVALPAHSRLTGISGRHGPRQIVALSFTYIASAEAFDPGLFQGSADSQDTSVDTGNKEGEDNLIRGTQTQTDWTPILVTVAVVASVLGFPMVRRFILG